MLMMLWALAVFSGDRCSSRSAFAASTTMVKKNRLRKARANNTIPTPLHNIHNGIHLDGADSFVPLSSATMTLLEYVYKRPEIWRTLTNHMISLPLQNTMTMKDHNGHNYLLPHCTKRPLSRCKVSFYKSASHTKELPNSKSNCQNISTFPNMSTPETSVPHTRADILEAAAALAAQQKAEEQKEEAPPVMDDERMDVEPAAEKDEENSIQLEDGWDNNDFDNALDEDKESKDDADKTPAKVTSPPAVNNNNNTPSLPKPMKRL